MPELGWISGGTGNSGAGVDGPGTPANHRLDGRLPERGSRAAVWQPAWMISRLKLDPSRRPSWQPSTGPESSIPSAHPASGIWLTRRCLPAACGGDPMLAQEKCIRPPARILSIFAASGAALLRPGRAPHLREAAQKCCGMLSEFSATAGDLAGNLEDLAASRQLDHAALILEQLETTVLGTVNQIDGITVEELRHQADGMSGQ